MILANLVEIYCVVDDFCKITAQKFKKGLLTPKGRNAATACADFRTAR